MRTLVTALRQHLAALRMLLVFTVILGIAYPLAITAIGLVPGLHARSDGSLLTTDGKVVGSGLIGQSFTDAKGNPLIQYFQSRPSAGTANVATGYDPTATSASNLGPESVVDTLPDPKDKSDTGTPSLLTQVCTRSLEVGRFDGVDGARAYCTSTGVGAVLAVFWSGPGYHGHVTRAVSVNQACPTRPFLRTYRGVAVQCATYGQDYSRGQTVPIRGDAPTHAAVPADAVTASASGLDPHISPAYAAIQERRVAAARGITIAQVRAVVATYRSARDLGFLGEPRVNVLELNRALDSRYPYRVH